MNVISRKSIWFIILFFFSTLWGIYQGSTNYSNIILSFWILCPIIIFLFSINIECDPHFLEDFINVATKVVLAVDIINIIFGLFLGFHPDFMALSYGIHFARMNGLAIINVILFVFYLNLFVRNRKKNNLIYSLFFLMCFLLCECGLAIICASISIIFLLFRQVDIKKYLYVVVCVGLIAYVFAHFSQDFYYYVSTIDMFKDSEIWEINFRKMAAFTNYRYIIQDNYMNFLFGVGPGGYNSRISFLLNTDANNPFTMLFGHSMPVFHAHFIYPLWDMSVVDIDSFNDGSRNKPFSSCLSVLAEYGIVMFILIYGYFFELYKKYRFAKVGEIECVILFIVVFITLMLLTDQWLESSEMFFTILFLKILAKLSINQNVRTVIVNS